MSARGGLKSPGKPFEISKRAVWKAWEKVRANNGAPGVDGESVADFEKDLKGAGVADNDECACGQVVGDLFEVREDVCGEGAGGLSGTPSVLNTVAWLITQR